MKVVVTTRSGVRHELTARPGDRLLDIVQAHGLPMEGTCEGAMACATCHVRVAKEWFGKLSPASDEELDMLDFVPDLSRTSRLACQIILAEGLEGLEVSLPTSVLDQTK